MTINFSADELKTFEDVYNTLNEIWQTTDGDFFTMADDGEKEWINMCEIIDYIAKLTNGSIICE